MTTTRDQPTLKEPPVLNIDPYAVDVLANPYPFHETLREAGPVVRIKPHNVYAVGRFDEAKIVLSDYNRFLAGGGIGIQDIRKPGLFRIPSRLLETDPPIHTKVRAVLARILTPIVIRRWRENLEKEAQQVVSDALNKGNIDGIEELAEAYILRGFPAVVGVRLPRTETLAIGEMRFNQSGPPNELFHQAVKRAEPYLTWFEESVQRQSVIPGSIAELVFQAEDAGELDEGVASNIVRSFVGGGTDSTISGLGCALNQLALSPEQWNVAKANPARLRVALDEAIRFETPFQVTYRTTVAEIELSGFRLEADTKIGVYLGAANRDPRKWPEPNKFDLTRNAAGVHIAFGTADHACIGQTLARLEAECLLSALVKSAKSIELTGSPTYRVMNQLRTLGRLPLRLLAA
jgi:cytochrome P450